MSDALREVLNMIFCPIRFIFIYSNMFIFQISNQCYFNLSDAAQVGQFVGQLTLGELVFPSVSYFGGVVASWLVGQLFQLFGGLFVSGLVGECVDWMLSLLSVGW